MTKSRLAWNLVLALALSGCQSWHVPTTIDVLGSSASERKIMKQARNDPFPSPAEAGLK